MKRACVIINAKSGKGHPPDWPTSLADSFTRAGIQADIKLLEDGEKIELLVRQALQDGIRLLVAGGGDGTINEVAAALVGSDAELGVLPLGTLNHFAKDLGIPLELDLAIALIGGGQSRRVDTAEVNGRLFLNNSSIGLYPDVVREREQQQQRLGRGKWLAFCWACMAALRRFPFLDVQLTVDGKLLARRTAFVFIGNNPYVMQGLDIGARERLDSGQLSVYTSRHTGRWGLLRLALSALFGRLRQAADLDMLGTTELAIETRHRQLQVSTDGEVGTLQMPLNYRIRPASLRVIAPPAKSAAGQGGG